MKWVKAPCKGCGETIEDEIEEDKGQVEDDWWCWSCWPEEDRRRLKERVAELEAACIALRDDLEETVGYAPGYFREKWDLGASLKLPAVAALPASGEKPEEPETCKWCDQPPVAGDNICTGHQKSHAAHSGVRDLSTVSYRIEIIDGKPTAVLNDDYSSSQSKEPK